MENMPFASIEEIDDISTLNEYKTALDAGLSPQDALAAVSLYSRDNARTPMQWADQPNAAFTCGTPWLKVNPNYKTINAEAQIHDPDSVWSFYKQLIALRKHPDYTDTIVYGILEPVWEVHKNLMAYYRKGEKTLLIIGNFQMQVQTVSLDHSIKNILLNNDTSLEQEGNLLFLSGYQVVILEL